LHTQLFKLLRPLFHLTHTQNKLTLIEPAYEVVRTMIKSGIDEIYLPVRIWSFDLYRDRESELLLNSGRCR
jgi:hypothetical protein